MSGNNINSKYFGFVNTFNPSLTVYQESDYDKFIVLIIDYIYIPETNISLKDCYFELIDINDENLEKKLAYKHLSNIDNKDVFKINEINHKIRKIGYIKRISEIKTILEITDDEIKKHSINSISL